MSVSWSSWPSSQEQTVKRWWFEANAWCDLQAQREFLGRIDSYVIVDPCSTSAAVPVTVLVYPPDDLVYVVKIQWLGG